MGQIEVRAEAETSASPARVFALLKDGSTWPLWSWTRRRMRSRSAPPPTGI